MLPRHPRHRLARRGPSPPVSQPGEAGQYGYLRRFGNLPAVSAHVLGPVGVGEDLKLALHFETAFVAARRVHRHHARCAFAFGQRVQECMGGEARRKPESAAAQAT